MNNSLLIIVNSEHYLHHKCSLLAGRTPYSVFAHCDASVKSYIFSIRGLMLIFKVLRYTRNGWKCIKKIWLKYRKKVHAVIERKQYISTLYDVIKPNVDGMARIPATVFLIIDCLYMQMTPSLPGRQLLIVPNPFVYPVP